jgi:hypothetical protein
MPVETLSKAKAPPLENYEVFSLISTHYLKIPLIVKYFFYYLLFLKIFIKQLSVISYMDWNEQPVKYSTGFSLKKTTVRLLFTELSSCIERLT